MAELTPEMRRDFETVASVARVKTGPPESPGQMVGCDPTLIVRASRFPDDWRLRPVASID
jgi:hypothetical protein